MQNPDPVNILLVDDQPGKLLSYEAILGSLGETLIKAASAREALAQLLKHDIAVVLIDVQMPEVDGFELAAMIREHPRFQETALIFVSAIHLSDLDRLKGYEAGAVDYVPVPVVPEVLRAKVRVFAELHRKTRALERLNAELEQRVAERTAALEASTLELQRLNSDLEVRIEERTREREQALAQLFEAQKIDTIGQLTGGVAHDFNNLLMAMMAGLQLLQKRVAGDARAIRLVENALTAAERGAALTQRLLAFARRQELRPEAVSVPALVLGMRDLLTRALGSGVQVVEEFDPDLPPVLIDANQLELALLNVSVNARDAMPDGGALTIRGTRARVDGREAEAPKDLRPGHYVRVSVSDNGAGMDEDVLARATEPFYTTKGVGKGTGLGLSMVHGLAAQTGGALKLSSQPGIGTRVELWIPVAEHAVAPAAAPERASDAKAGAWSSSDERVLTILLVDDDSLVSAGTSAMLEDLGHTVREVASAAEALALLERGGHIDLVITDHVMPGMSGVELARTLKDLRPDLRVILASGYADLVVGDKLDFHLPRLPKPFLQADIRRAISQAIDAPPPPRQPLGIRASV
ncbi:MAG: Histidine kinase [Caulobacteraceae bacterium]|nr:Histidine kinase [Caulobacteraceae bacterium]